MEASPGVKLVPLRGAKVVPGVASDVDVDGAVTAEGRSAQWDGMALGYGANRSERDEQSERDAAAVVLQRSLRNKLMLRPSHGLSTTLRDMEKPWYPPAAWGSARERLFIFLDDANATRGGRVNAFVVMTTIIISTAAFVVETMPSNRAAPPACAAALAAKLPLTVAMCEPKSGPVFEVVEAICIMIFTVDYALRLLCVGACPPDVAGVRRGRQTELSSRQVVWRYAVQPLNVIDFLAIAPWCVRRSEICARVPVLPPLVIHPQPCCSLTGCPTDNAPPSA